MAEPGGRFVTAAADGLRCAVRVTPRAARDAVHGPSADGTALRVSVTAAPDRGAANKAVIHLLAKAWRVPKTRITLRSGAASRNKVLHVAGDPAELRARIGAWESGRHAG